MKDVALDYYDAGFSIIPIRPNKHPFVSEWKSYQTTRPDREQIETWWTKNPEAMIAIITGALSGICCLDADSKDAGKFIRDVCPDICDPHAKTPRETGGWHWYFRPTKVFSSVNGKLHKDIDFKCEGGYVIVPPSVRDGVTYKFLNGFDFRNMEPLPQELHELITEHFNFNYGIDETGGYIDSKYSSSIEPNGSQPIATSKQQTATIATFSEGSRDEDLFRLANCLVKGGMEVDNIKGYLDFFAARCNPPFSPKDARIKIKSALRRKDDRTQNLTAILREWIVQQNGNFKVTNAYHEATIATLKEKSKVRALISRFVKDGFIEPVGKNAGVYRRIEAEIPDIDIYQDHGPSFDIRYPLGMHQFFETMQRTIVAVVGSPDAGKTCFALNICAANMNRGFPIRYQTSEMSGQELVKRLKMFEPDIPFSRWENVSFKEKESDWHDLVLPDGLNIIDYVDLSEDFFLMGKYIRMIFDKLDKGVAIVCLQKKFGHKLAYGAETTLKLPRLYFTIESNPPEGNIAEIVKCKNRMSGTPNHTGRRCNFTIRDGARINQVTGWEYPSTKKGKG